MGILWRFLWRGEGMKYTEADLKKANVDWMKVAADWKEEDLKKDSADWMKVNDNYWRAYDKVQETRTGASK